MNTRQKVVLDACVLYSAVVRDILLNLAQRLLFDPHWSPIIQDEWTRNLLKNRTDLDEKRINRTVGFMSYFFPLANVTNFDHHIPGIELPDPDDRHVVACAIQCEAEIIVTFDLKDFPVEELEKFGIIPQHPDDFICDLFEMNEKAAIEALNVQLETLRKPRRTKEELLETFKKCDLAKAAELFAQITE